MYLLGERVVGWDKCWEPGDSPGQGGNGGGHWDGGVTVVRGPSSRSEYWRGQRKALRQLLWGVSPEGSVGTALVHTLRQPLTHHVQKYALLLLSLRDTVGEVSGRGPGAAHQPVACGDAEAGEVQGPGSGHLRNSGTLV